MSNSNPDNERQPSPRAAWRNLLQPMPLSDKLRLFYRNTAIKLRKRQNCCGNFGQPGC